VSSLDFASVMVAVLIAVGASTWINGILHRAFDYDEWVHAYESWLVSGGLKPFRDFFECHPPFAWYPLSLFFRVFGNSYNLLFVFRFLTGIGHLVFLVAMLKNVALSLRELPTPVRLPLLPAAVAVAFIAMQPAIIEYLVEFRLDSWPNALLMIAIYRYRLRRADALRSSIELAALSTAAILCSPKLVMFVGLFGVASVVVDDRRLVRAGGMLAGGLGMLGLGAGFLKLAGHNPVHVYRLALGYHSVLNAKGGFGHGVYEIVWSLTAMRNVVIASAIAWPLVAWRRLHRAPFEIAALLFLVLQLRLVGFGYKQYYAPWFLLAITFLPYLEVLARRMKLVHSLLLVAAVLFTFDSVMPVYRTYQDGSFVDDDIAARKNLEATLVKPGHFVIASIETRPLFRRDAVYQHHNSYAPSGFDGTRVMQELKIEPYSLEFTVEKARAEIEARSPDLIITNARLPGYVRTALEQYLAKHPNEYTRQDGHFGAYLVRKH
jgi:hypothetical protein